MTPAASGTAPAVPVLAGLRAAGVTVVLRPDGTVGLTAAVPPPPGLLAAARAHRGAIVAFLRERAGAAPVTPSDAAPVSPGIIPADPAAKRPPSWADSATVPRPGAWCSCCRGWRWWREASDPRGWRCWTCHPPLHLAPGQVREVAT